MTTIAIIIASIAGLAYAIGALVLIIKLGK